jgi:hypothetical protein
VVTGEIPPEFSKKYFLGGTGGIPPEFSKKYFPCTLGGTGALHKKLILKMNFF